MLTVFTKKIERDSFSLHLHRCKCYLLVKKLDGVINHTRRTRTFLSIEHIPKSKCVQDS